MLQHWVDTITIEDINKEAASLLSFASHYGTEAELLEEEKQDPERFAPPGPTRTTAIVACFPAFTDPHGESIGGYRPQLCRFGLVKDMGEPLAENSIKGCPSSVRIYKISCSEYM